MTHKNYFPVIMKGTAFLCAVLTAVFAAAFHFSQLDLFLTLAITTGTTCYHFSMRLIVGLLIPVALGKNADPNGFWFRSRCFEAPLYRRLKVRQWKHLLPTYEPESFSLESCSIAQIIQSSCTAEVVHEVIVVLSFLPLLASVPFGAFGVFLITSVFSAAYDSLFVILQRYNRPRFIKLSIRRQGK